MGELDFSTFLTIMHRQMQQEDPKTEILEALRMTDKQKKGYILASELRTKLTGLGEKLTDKEGTAESYLWIIRCSSYRESFVKDLKSLTLSFLCCNSSGRAV